MKPNSWILWAIVVSVVFGVIYGCHSWTQNTDHTTHNVPPASKKKPTEQNTREIYTQNTQASQIFPPSSDDISQPTNQDNINQPMSIQLDTNIIRSDVRHILQATFSEKQELDSALLGAAILQDYLNNPQQNANEAMRRYDCTVINLTDDKQTLIKYLTFDTPQRQQVLKNGLKDYQPAISREIQIDSTGNAISPCQQVTKVKPL